MHLSVRLASTLAVAAGCLAGASLYAQTPPPIRMGLWESTNTITMTGLQLPPDVIEKLKAMGRSIPGSTPQTMTAQSCYTPEEWQKSMADARRHRDEQCTQNNLSFTSSKMVFDESCTTSRGDTTTGHFEMYFDDAEHAHGSGHFTTTGGQGSQAGHPLNIDMTVKGHFVSADCGEVKPGSPKIINHQ
ncbi:DUF3617 domain-containing protein [Paracidobacterium acidisoli]|nr:DUF3617 domain-containing protein [Paracidobacterium acidisoli]MBT9329735.1 DUF3617 domain-containing protein [Paracidobacterium acidisoli]